MIHFQSVFFLIGVLLVATAAAMGIPLITELVIYKTNNYHSFVVASFLCYFFGSTLVLATRPQEKISLGMREAFLVTCLSWIFLSLSAGLPFYIANPVDGFINAWFEAVSSLTTTGVSVIPELEKTPKGLLLWRSLLQWLGGTGIVVMAMTLFPTLRIGGMQLFRSEFSDRSEKILPRLSQIATGLLSVYSVLTAICAFLLYWAGMNAFDAICHAMSTVSTGGFSTHSYSVSFYNNPLIEGVVMLFMALGGVTLTLYIKFWRGDFKDIVRDSQLKNYLSLLLLSSLIITLWQWFYGQKDFLISLRHGAFAAISMVTTTGFISDNYANWGCFPTMLLFILSMVGGCTGSTTGGVKIFRLQVLFALTKSHLLQLRRPHGVYIPCYQNHKISDSVAFSVFTFITLYFVCLVLLALALAATGLDFLTSLSGAAACLSNGGSGIGDIIGPYSSVHQLGKDAKIIMMTGMILGRLELLTVLVLLLPSFWRD